MQSAPDFKIELFNAFSQPVIFLRDGKVAYANHAAAACGVDASMELAQVVLEENGSVKLRLGDLLAPATCCDYLDGALYDFSKPVLSDLTLTAKWKLINEPIDPILPALIPATKTPTTGRFPFTDVTTGDWFYDAVKGAWENGLINGVTATTYQPKGTLTVAEAIKLASALHQMIKDGKVTLTNGRGYWYETYVNYGVREGILDESYQKLSYEQMTKPVSRSEFVHIFFKAVGSYKTINSVADNSIPDVKTTDSYGDEIYTFYRAGILTGSDAAGTFHPASTIVRSEAAAILVRMYDASYRVNITLK